MNWLVGVAFIISLQLAASSASAQTLLSHFSDAAVSKVAARFSKTMHDGGISGVIADIRSCYAATNFTKTQANGNAIALCMLYDYSAVQMDKGMRTNFVAQGWSDPGSATSYLSDNALNARFATYAPIPFGDDPSAVGAYFADAPSKVLDRLKF
ncbi:MAG TPA: hypothetical protein VHU87_00005 [Rhizomicrobium sp.]|jgi:expansin (peptidoglycan-binding protein)|nr:hypothetical protein [Rhizomicrobium sp.]